MVMIDTVNETKKQVREWKRQGLSVGLVPTMGYLHAGHKSLIEKARTENDKVAVSIFVNPIQFGPNEDFEKYPRDTAHDLGVCGEAGADLVFVPALTEMYPAENLAYIDVYRLGDGLCGASRENHFRGVCTVVAKLLNIFLPDRAYFGQKDAQQLAIVRQMAVDLNFDTEIVPCPIIREADGLALSSRNAYLSEKERSAALVLHQSLRHAESVLRQGERNAVVIQKTIEDRIAGEPLARLDYAVVADAATLAPVMQINRPVLVALAVYIGKTRLIDNFIFGEGLV